MSAIAQIAEEKGISVEKVLETIEMAIAAAYKKDYGKKGQIIKAKLEPGSGDVKFRQVKLIVDKDMIYSETELLQMEEKVSEKMKALPPEVLPKETAEEETGKKVRFNSEKHIMLEEAKKINPKIKVGEELEIPLETKEDYGRIAAKTQNKLFCKESGRRKKKAFLQSISLKKER